MKMDSRAVAIGIRNEIWPLLRADGFAKFSAKTARRNLVEQIHVVNFQSFNSYVAESVRCTTFSFALNLGIYFRSVPIDYPIRGGPDPSVKPQEYHCHFRHRLFKGIEQKALPRRDTWYVEPDGTNLPETLSDARRVLELEGLPWFRKFESLEGVLRLLLEEDNLPDVHAAQGSPARKYLIGHIARSLGRTDIADPMIAEAESELETIRSQILSLGKRQQAQP